MPNIYNAQPGTYVATSYSTNTTNLSSDYIIISHSDISNQYAYYSSRSQPIYTIDGYFGTYRIVDTPPENSIDGYSHQLSLDFDSINLSIVPNLVCEKVVKDGDLLIPKFNREVDYKILKAIGLFVKNKVRDDLSEEESEIAVKEIATAFIKKLQKENKLSYSLNTKKFRYIE